MEAGGLAQAVTVKPLRIRVGTWTLRLGWTAAGKQVRPVDVVAGN